jgi:membrane protein DedA with SNARE-associated domain
MSGSSTSPSGAMSSGSSSSSSGMPIWLTVLVGVLGLLIGGTLAFAFTRRSGPSPNAGG